MCLPSVFTAKSCHGFLFHIAIFCDLLNTFLDIRKAFVFFFFLFFFFFFYSPPPLLQPTPHSGGFAKHFSVFFVVLSTN
jgi:hypothetical protein